jgi:hypothetical protein
MKHIEFLNKCQNHWTLFCMSYVQDRPIRFFKSTGGGGAAGPNPLQKFKSIVRALRRIIPCVLFVKLMPLLILHVMGY